jgi:hypothetical protein
MQKMHIAKSDKPFSKFSLDVIISIGNLVKSIRGTQFRQWATQRLKDYLIEGIALNENRLNQKNKEMLFYHPYPPSLISWCCEPTFCQSLK